LRGRGEGDAMNRVDGVDTHHASLDARSAADIAQRTRLLRGLVLGTSSSADLDLLTSGYRIAADGYYRAVRCRPAGDSEARAVERALGCPLAEQVEHELLAVMRASTEPRPHIAMGIGSPVVLADLPRSFAEATAALDTAIAFGMSGAVTLEELGVKVAVATRPEIGNRLSARFVEPLLAAGATGTDILETVAAHLRAGLRVNRTAQALFVHPNTVRHRLRRFEESTGARLDEIEDVVGVWWALRHHTLGS